MFLYIPCLLWQITHDDDDYDDDVQEVSKAVHSELSSNPYISVIEARLSDFSITQLVD